MVFQPAFTRRGNVAYSKLQDKDVQDRSTVPAILKANTYILTLILTNIINQSYESSTVPASMKHAVIMPLLKRSRLSADDYASYRNISNLSYASKLLERHVSAQLRLHLQGNDFVDSFQSAYRPAHSVETAIVCIQDDVLRYLGVHKHVVLALLDLNTTFDTINHDILSLLPRNVLYRRNTVSQCGRSLI